MGLSVVTNWFALGAAYAWYDWATQFKDGDGFVGPTFFADYAKTAKIALRGTGRGDGLIPGFDGLRCDEFDPLQVDPLIRRFYRSSSRFELHVVRNTWNPKLSLIASMVTAAARQLGQLNIPLDTIGEMESEFQLLDVNQDGRHDFVCWVRRFKDAQGSARGHFYTGAFRPFLSVVDGLLGAYLACAFPLPGANIAAVLKFHNTRDGGFRASSLPLPQRTRPRGVFTEAGSYIGSHEAGTYIVIPLRRSLCILPAFGLAEDFRFRAAEDAQGPMIRGQHRCLWLGNLAFRLDYVIRPPAEAARRGRGTRRPR